MFTRVKNEAEIKAMRESGRILASVLQTVKKQTEPGMSTKDLSRVALQELKRLGGEAAFLGYQGFPDVLCVSLNDEVVHGIPRDDKIIQPGDIVSIDFGVIYKSMITDGAISFIAGNGSNPKHERLIKVTEQSMYSGIDQLHNGVKTGDIGYAVETVLNKNGYGIVRDLVGHGVGHYLHEDPNIPNYGRKGTGPILTSGMTVAIEPMATLGGDDIVVAPDGWTILTQDHSWSAHFEHTVLVTQSGAEILTIL